MVKRPGFCSGQSCWHSKAKESIKADEKIAVSVDVENRGNFDADEVVQLYITVPDESGSKPL